MNVTQISLFELGFSKETKPSCSLTKSFGILADAERKLRTSADVCIKDVIKR